MQARDEHKKQIALYWKNESVKVVKALSESLRNETSGIADIDGEIHLTTASRHQSNINKSQATVVLQPKVRV